MKKPPKTPKQIAEQIKNEKKVYSFSLIKKNVDIIQSMASAAGISTSVIIDEALSNYIESVQPNKK